MQLHNRSKAGVCPAQATIHVACTVRAASNVNRLLGCRYSVREVAGGALAVSGLAVLMLSDKQSGSAPAKVGLRPFLGDALVIVGASGYAVSNVLTEHVLAQADSIELLAGMGGFGFLWSLFNIAAFEAPALATTPWQARALACFVAYTVTLFGFYCGAMRLLQSNGSVVRPAYDCTACPPQHE